MVYTNIQKREKWQEIIFDWKQSGLNAKKWCEANKIKYSRFQYWRDRLSRPETSSSTSQFLELSVNQENNLDKTPIEVSVGPVKITLQHNFNEVTLERLITILRRNA